MADEEQTVELDHEEKPSHDTGILILQELQTMNRLLGTINQNITSIITPIKHDVELCKVALNKMKKAGAQEFTIKDERSPAPYIPPGLE